MTITEKLEMYKGKKAFIENISKAFETQPRVSSVTSVDYEVYHRTVVVQDIPRDHFVEYLVIHFLGGGKSAMLVSGNSCTANFRILGPRLDGGYYDENREYETLNEKGFTKVNLDEAKLGE